MQTRIIHTLNYSSGAMLLKASPRSNHSKSIHHFS
jgi:hypothetical protein